ncbi:chromosome segregation protein SMC [Hephaestia sp. GCM10023244]|uniref:chromosome segregation protein SMC n=1 Tax=unclassified Hephaestia TaxID=2631281 RepID=UPI00207717E0|nr:chromosome segregation protein SMC [Hephaestia sp. MAHUQ-44]
MQIKRLRLSGFKSFVDPVDLRIERGLTGIVGPNGCGKSNLLEALRWAMGENSAKSMRGAGMEDVIFAGTARRPSRDFAEVSILLDQANGDETEVVRRIERGAGSAYRLDGRDVRAKDVSLLFADAATGAHSPALVSQGRIGAVIAAKPVERRVLLEEAAGIAGLHVRRKDAEQKLRATEANLARLDEVIADQESRANALRRQARQAEKYRALSEQIRVAEGRMIYARWRDAAAAADAAKAEADSAEARVRATGEAQRAAAAYQTQATDTLADARAAALAARDTASEAGHKLAALRQERAQVDRRIEELDQIKARLAADREREGALAQDAANALQQIGDETTRLDAAIAATAARQPALESALAEAERAARDAEVALAQALSRQASEAADARVAGAALASAREQLARVERDRAKLDAERAALGPVAPIEAERAAAAAARKTAIEAAEQARAARDAAQAAEQRAIERQGDAQAARARARADLAAINSEAAAIDKALQSTARDRLLDKLTAMPGYERALAAALGDELEVGLDREADRFWGGATRQESDPPLPAGTNALADHVTAPPELARRLAQIAVAAEDEGAALSIGQRLVTLGGAMRRWDGFVARSGGAAAAERLLRVNRLAELNAARPSAVAAVEKAEAALAAIDAAIADARQAAQQARAPLAAAETAEREAARAEDRAAGAIERLQGLTADLDARAARIGEERDQARGTLAAAERAVAALPDGAATRDAVVALQTGAEARRAGVVLAQADRATFERTLAADREALTRARGEANDWKARAGDAARRIADMDKREKALAEEAEAIAGRPEKLLADIEALEGEHEAARARADALLAAEADAGEAVRRTEDRARIAGEALAQAREARAGAVARAENQEQRRIEMGRLSGERFACPPPVLPERIGFASAEVGSPQDESGRHDRLMLDRERIGPVNLVAEAELAELDDARTTNATEREELRLAVNRLRGSIGNLNREGRQRLLAAFEAVNVHFQRLFTTLFNGGHAHLELVDSDDPLEAGLEIMAQPPGKKLQSLTLLSGGEQALTAVALIFGLFLTNPAPICVLDEVDAPLDDANIERFCNLLEAMTQETQTRYLIVTHNAVTMSRMDRLFGVTMIEQGVSRLVSVDLRAAETLLAAE